MRLTMGTTTLDTFRYAKKLQVNYHYFSAKSYYLILMKICKMNNENELHALMLSHI